MTKIIVAGSRDIDDVGLVFEGLIRQLDGDWDVEIVSGGARGPDHMGEIFAKHYSLPVKQFIPDWDGLGKRAGYVRNAEMAKYADRAIIFWDGVSKGTKHMIDLATKEGLRVDIIHCRKEWAIVKIT